MMDNLKHFSPKSHLTTAENLHEFIRMCRDDLTVFGASLNWDDVAWPKACNFTKLGAHSRGFEESDKMDDVFIDFAKAYFRYQQGHKPTETKNESKALRVIEAALLQVQGNANISGINVSVLDEATLLAKNHYSQIAAYHCGRELQRLATFTSEKHLIPAHVGTWKSSIKKPSDVTIRTGLKAKAIQDKKLPHQDVLDALAEIFANNPTNPKDIFTTSVFAMTMCAPVRISEILELPDDCEVECVDSKGETQYGWRFFSAKGFEGDIKWIPHVMVPIAKEAVSRIRNLTAEARKLALWIEKFPNKPYRHAACPNVADDAPLTPFQACAYLGLVNETPTACHSSLKSAKLSTENGDHSLNRLWQYAMLRQPKELPWLSKKKKIKYGNALFCMTRNLIGSQRGTSPVILWAPTNNIFNNDLSPRISESTQNHQSIFDRCGYKTKDGERIKATSHQARHLISTLANRGGLSQEMIAKWAGRADPKQNRVYNHESEWEIIAKAEALDTSLSLFGPAGEISQHIPVTTQEVNLMERGALHASLYGVCSHDFIMSPCGKFRDCLNCEEHICIKGSDGVSVERLERMKALLAQVEIDFLAAKVGLAEGYSGADRWYESHEKTAVRLRQLIEILESPQIPEGAQIKLHDGKDFSHLRRVIRLKAVDALEHGTSDAALLADMARLLEESHGSTFEAG
jgi:hypothetical protein